MTSKEKAQEIVSKYTNMFSVFVPAKNTIRQCALIAVDEILDKDGYNNDYWKEVKQEIEKL